MLKHALSLLISFVFIFYPSFSCAGVAADISAPWVPEARPYLYFGAAATTFLLVFEDQIVDPAQKETIEDKPLGKWSKLGDYSGRLIPNAIYGFGMLGHYYFTKNPQSYRRAVVMGKASVYSGLLTTVLKEIVREPRPNNPKSRESFPSGHATTAFAFSSVVAAEHGFWAGSAAVLLSTFTAYSRMNDNRHYFHDVIAGATIGATYGIGLSALSRKETALEGTESPKEIGFYPYYSYEEKGVTAYMRF